MRQLQTAAVPPDLDDAPADLRDFLEALASEGISASLPSVGPDNILPEPLAVRTSLSAAIVDARTE